MDVLLLFSYNRESEALVGCMLMTYFSSCLSPSSFSSFSSPFNFLLTEVSRSSLPCRKKGCEKINLLGSLLDLWKPYMFSYITNPLPVWWNCWRSYAWSTSEGFPSQTTNSPWWEIPFRCSTSLWCCCVVNSEVREQLPWGSQRFSARNWQQGWKLGPAWRGYSRLVYIFYE